MLIGLRVPQLRVLRMSDGSDRCLLIAHFGASGVGDADLDGVVLSLSRSLAVAFQGSRSSGLKVSGCRMRDGYPGRCAQMFRSCVRGVSRCFFRRCLAGRSVPGRSLRVRWLRRPLIWGLRVRGIFMWRS